MEAKISFLALLPFVPAVAFAAIGFVTLARVERRLDEADAIRSRIRFATRRRLAIFGEITGR